MSASKLTTEDFTRRLDEAAIGIDDNRWKVAELAWDCKQAEYPQWPQIIGRHPRIRRAERTIRDYALTAEFRDAIGHVEYVDEQQRRYPLPYSFYAEALRYLDRLPTDTIKELMETAAAEKVGLEEFRAELKTQAGAPEPDPAKKWRKASENYYSEASKRGGKVGDHLSNAALALGLAAAALAEPEVEEPDDSDGGTLDGVPQLDTFGARVFEQVAAQINAGALGPNVTASVSRR